MNIKSLSAAARNERAVAHYLNSIKNVSAERPKVGSKYPDVQVWYQGQQTWMEVKMNENDQMGTPRVSFDGDKWVSKDSPIQRYACQQLNMSKQTACVLHELRKFTGNPHVKIPTTKGGLSVPNAPTIDQIKEFFSARDQYILVEEDVDLGHLVAAHYNYGKIVPAHYIQLGDQFFQMGDQDPFNIFLPKLKYTGTFKVRISIRSRFYEVIPEIKVRGQIYSPYSVAPGTLKNHPFT